MIGQPGSGPAPTQPSAGQPKFIVGRSLEDYRKANHSVEPDFVILECRVCRCRIAVSPGGYATWQAKLTPETTVSGALCNPCALAITALMAADGEVGTLAEAQAKRSPKARLILELFKTLSES